MSWPEWQHRRDGDLRMQVPRRHLCPECDPPEPMHAWEFDREAGWGCDRCGYIEVAP